MFQRQSLPRLRREPESLDSLKDCLERAGDQTSFALSQGEETKCFQAFHQQSGWDLNLEQLTSTLAALSFLGAGNEHDVYFHPDSRRVLKITNTEQGFGAQGAPFLYLSNLENQNTLFADSVKFEGILKLPTGYRILTSQRFIPGRPATEDEIARFFTSLGLAPQGNHFYQGEIDHKLVKIFDARPDNVLLETENNAIRTIDVQIKIETT